MIGNNDVWSLLQVESNNMDLLCIQKTILQDAITELQRSKDTGKTPVIREKQERSRRLFDTPS